MQPSICCAIDTSNNRDNNCYGRTLKPQSLPSADIKINISPLCQAESLKREGLTPPYQLVGQYTKLHQQVQQSYSGPPKGPISLSFKHQLHRHPHIQWHPVQWRNSFGSATGSCLMTQPLFYSHLNLDSYLLAVVLGFAIVLELTIYLVKLDCIQ